LASLPFLSLLLTTYTHKHVSHQVKANFSWNQMWILFVCAYCIKQCSVQLKKNLKNVPKPQQFNVLSLPRFNFSLATWKLVIYPYWQVCNTQTLLLSFYQMCSVFAYIPHTHHLPTLHKGSTLTFALMWWSL